MDSAPAQRRLIEAIRGDLLSARFKPGERLVVNVLASRYETPPAAIRTALVTLAAEGLVERPPHRSASVRALTIDEGIEIAEIRRELEALCARHAANVATAAEKGEILGLVEAMRIATNQSLPDEYHELSVRFHDRIADVAQQVTARRFLREMRNHRLDLHFPAAFESDTTTDSLLQHEKIARAIADGDPDGSERLMRDHVSEIVALLEQYAATRRADDSVEP